MADLPVKERKLFVGIDPGKTGGMGVVDQEGQFVAAYRWDQKDPRRIYLILEALAKGSTEEKLCQVHNRHRL